MRILFIHQNFPGQFKFLAPALAELGHHVTALTLRQDIPSPWQGVHLIRYQIQRGSTPGIHPWVADIETQTLRGEACYHTALALKKSGYNPDLVIAHPGWGESLFIKDVWPDTRLGLYCEYFYHARGTDVGFDPEFPISDALAARIRLKNINNLLHIPIADAGISPTHWQASTFPNEFRRHISVIHDGIDTQRLQPNPAASIMLGTVRLTRNDPIITFVNRNLEPYRGYHRFMRALPYILNTHSTAQIFIVGNSNTGYGAAPVDGTTWKEIYLREAQAQIPAADWQRVHYVNALPYEQYVTLLQLSTIHVYLTYPFVLSWSLLEAMSLGCAIVASDTPPVLEAIKHGETGLLVDFFDHRQLADTISALLHNEPERQRLGQNTREFAQAHYDLKTICLPRQLNWAKQLADA